jgi:UDP-GlcNAc:undecaprenyl-phosphate GlcNAc-1-phosphate transferase
MLLYALGSFGVPLIIMPLLIWLCKIQGWYDPINDRKIHSDRIPRLGSVGFVPAFLLCSALYMKKVQAAGWHTYIPLVVAGALIFLLGLIDDFSELSALTKFIGQCMVSLIPVIFGLQFTRLGPFALGILSPVLTFCWIVGIINAFNLIDGIDALCGGISLSIVLTLGVIFHAEHSRYMGVSVILGGGILGFLVYNKPPAKIFMGDGGSQFLGFIIAVLPLGKAESTLAYNLFPVMIALTAIPLLDTMAAIWRRSRDGRSFFSPDKRHLHHKLMSMGYSVKSILFFLLILQGGLCGISLAAVLWIGGIRGFVLLCGTFAAMAVFFAIMHYTSRSLPGNPSTKLRDRWRV